ncbi:hypothetical protein [Actinophytocola sp.]|uniref:hypothetical protein n=1 Tax=Actinophytocola sp. TaxID=1872138 RepID=UPI00389AF04D
MIKKVGFVAAGVFAGMSMLGSFASAEGVHVGQFPGGEGDETQTGVVNVNNVDVLHNVNATVGVCDNNINVLGVQVPVQHTLNGINLPLFSPTGEDGEHEAVGATPENCAVSAAEDGGTVQSN